MRIFYSALLTILVSTGFTQDLPIFNQYAFDPYLINPSYIAQRGYSEINLLYRQQWTGIEDAPRTIAANFQYAASPRMSIGLTAYNHEVVLLSTSSVMATFGYRVPFSRRHFLSFGISSGIISDRIQLEDVEDPNDPVFARNGNTLNMDGQFGVNYTNKRFTLGFSLLKLFENTPLPANEGGIKFSQLSNKAVTASYLFTLSPSLDFMPYVQYRFTDNYNFIEGTGIFTYKNFISLGGFYRQEYGPGFILRVRLNKKIDFGYGHEFATNQAKNFLGGTHELQFKILVGEKGKELLTKNEERTIDSTSVAQNDIPAQPVKEINADIVAKENPARKDSIIKVESISPDATENQPPLEEIKTPVLEETKPDDKLEERYFLIVGAFKSSSNALAFLRTVKSKGLKAEMQFSKALGYYYVFLPEYNTIAPSIEQLFEIRDKIQLKDAWYKKGPLE